MSDEKQVVKAERSNAAIGSRGIEIRNMDELVRFAVAVKGSGLAPKGIETEQAIAVAIQMGLEVGLSPMAALQNIAVINGRPSIWGDAQLAVCRATGELEIFEEWMEAGGKRLDRTPQMLGDDATAVCRVKRRGYPVSENTFSVTDAKRAGLWDKVGPWKQYPTRMLKFRARSFILRDQFGDALKGLLSTEEVRDIEADPVEKARNITPAQTRVAVSQPVKRSFPVLDDTDDVDMSPQKRTATEVVQEAPASATFPVSEAAQGTPAGQLGAMIKDAGASFEDFLFLAKEERQIPAEAEIGSLDEVSVQVLNHWIAKPKAFPRAITTAKAIRTGGGR